MFERHPIIAHGEVYADPITKPSGPIDKKCPHEYAEAKHRILKDICSVENEIISHAEHFMEEKILCVRLEPKFEAKSYVPSSLLSAMPEGNAQIVGGRRYHCINDDLNQDTQAKLYFFRTTDRGIQQLKDALTDGTRDNIATWQQQIRSIASIDLLRSDEKILGFSHDWNSGTAEFVLHPMPNYTHQEIHNFIEMCELSEKEAQIRVYDDGIVFISAHCTMDAIKKASVFNPLRAIHPIGNINIAPVRQLEGSTCPQIVDFQKPAINIGVFDGGADNSIPILKPYVNAVDATSAPADKECIAHGSGVCSAILFGNLAGKTPEDVLDAPCASIDCYRVLPLENNQDIDLYEAIDTIERVVSSAPNTRLFNLSFGPVGAIVDDSISRFTYALDKLSYDVPEGVENPLFVVAVGNDGDLEFPFNRIQAPADMVNGLGIGAYSYNAKHDKVRANYSCIGPGREGGKTKPDVLEFGGSMGYPFIIPAIAGNSLSAVMGTSFAAPTITGKIGKILSSSDDVSPHMGRTLLIHNAETSKDLPGDEQGFGFAPERIENVLECEDNRVTIMYNGEIFPKQFLRLPIFIPSINSMKGNVTIAWTVATVVAPYANDPDAYTNNCLEDVFTPHSMIYNFTKQGSTPKRCNLLIEEDIPRIKQLIDSGYKQSYAPVSHPSHISWDESNLRNSELKWDTVIHKYVSMRSSSLFDPSLTLHAIGRNGFETHPIKYYVVITIEAPRYQGNLYNNILQTYQALAPVQLRNETRINVV